MGEGGEVGRGEMVGERRKRELQERLLGKKERVGGKGGERGNQNGKERQNKSMYQR